MTKSAMHNNSLRVPTAICIRDDGVFPGNSCEQEGGQRNLGLYSEYHAGEPISRISSPPLRPGTTRCRSRDAAFIVPLGAHDVAGYSRSVDLQGLLDNCHSF